MNYWLKDSNFSKGQTHNDYFIEPKKLDEVKFYNKKIALIIISY
jgi:hypothetical protein